MAFSTDSRTTNQIYIKVLVGAFFSNKRNPLWSYSTTVREENNQETISSRCSEIMERRPRFSWKDVRIERKEVNNCQWSRGKFNESQCQRITKRVITKRVHLCFRASKELQGVSVWLNKNLRQSTLQAWKFFYVNLDHLFKWNRFHLWYKPSYKYVSDGLIHQKLCNCAYESFLQIFHCLSTAMSTNKVDCSKLEC